MSDSLLKISSAVDPVLPAETKRALDSIYSKIPSVTCGCDRLGQCCELTQEEAADDWATMYPLYAVEYLNIVDFVRSHFSSDEQERVLSFDEERPMRCPFLTEAGRCSVHPSRPLICRTYGIMSKDQVIEARDRLEGEVPSIWLRTFEKKEFCTVCSHTEVEEPNKVTGHAESMATFAYDNKLLSLAKTFDGLDDDHRDLYIKATGRYRVSRWTWGGFNTVWRKPVSWLKKNLVGYLDRAGLLE